MVLVIYETSKLEHIRSAEARKVLKTKQKRKGNVIFVAEKFEKTILKLTCA